MDTLKIVSGEPDARLLYDEPFILTDYTKYLIVMNFQLKLRIQMPYN